MIYQTNVANDKTFIVVGYAVYVSTGDLFSTVSALYTEDMKCAMGDTKFAEEIIAYLEQAGDDDVWGDAEHYRSLVRHEDYRVRALVALNGQYLDILCDDPSIDVRECVVRRLIKAYSDVSELKKVDLKRSYVENIVLSMVEHTLIADEDDPTIGYMLARAPFDINSEVHQLLKHHQSSSVRAGVASSTTDATLLEELASDDDWYVRNATALNSSTPEIILSKLREDREMMVRVAASCR